MKNRTLPYLLLLFSLTVQMILLRYVTVFPDLVLMTAVFGGIFLGPFQGAALGLAGGFLRGCFSSGTIGPDMVVFSISAYLSSVFSMMFYKRNPLFHIFSVLISAVCVFMAQAVYLSYRYGADISPIAVLAASRTQIFLTALAAPLLFPLWAFALEVEE